MCFSKSEQNAIEYVVKEMLSHGSGSIVEKATAHSLLSKVGYNLNSTHCKKIVFQEAINVIKPMSLEKKKAVLAILANIMVADGHIKVEKQQWLNTVSIYCKIPSINWDEVWQIIDSL
ncbi:MAG: hypothetical protein J6U94_02715 [Paludibacteraceae bacterium]|nr:hypothetical protein [Paludibacteraceae bacterium]